MAVKVPIKEGDSAYDALAEAMVCIAGMGHFSDTYILDIRTSVLGEDRVIMRPGDGWWTFDDDWYEGGELELLGYINLKNIDIPRLLTNKEIQ
jgi:hypothetical protein